MGVNSLLKTVTRRRRDSDLNPGPSALESSTLTTRNQEKRTGFRAVYTTNNIKKLIKYSTVLMIVSVLVLK